jgi:hypothetical protein
MNQLEAGRGECSRCPVCCDLEGECGKVLLLDGIRQVEFNFKCKYLWDFGAIMLEYFMLLIRMGGGL